MQLKNPSRRIKLLSIILGIASLVILLFCSAPRYVMMLANSQTQNSPLSLVKIISPPIELARVSFKNTISIRIPKIGVDAHIKQVGLTSQGSVGVPDGPVDTAWFNLSSYPGEIGTAVIVGHYGWKDGISAVFDNLSKLRLGDKIYVQDKNGLIIIFSVRKSQRYNSNTNTADVFYSNDGKSHLNLITCEGTWDKVSKSYSKRLVVFADREMP